MRQSTRKQLNFFDNSSSNREKRNLLKDLNLFILHGEKAFFFFLILDVYNECVCCVLPFSKCQIVYIESLL